MGYSFCLVRPNDVLVPVLLQLQFNPAQYCRNNGTELGIDQFSFGNIAGRIVGDGFEQIYVQRELHRGIDDDGCFFNVLHHVVSIDR